MRERIVFVLSLAVLMAGPALAVEPSEKDKQAIRGELNQFLQRQTIDGKFFHYDPIEGRMLVLQFDEVHEGIKPAGELFVACVDFRDQFGRKLDVDIIVAPAKGSYRAIQALLHKVDGEKRSYDLQVKEKTE